MIEHPKSDKPVYVGAYVPEDRDRYVHVVRPDGDTVRSLCADQDQFAAFVAKERPGTDLDDPAQVFWADHPGEWSGR